MQTRVNAFVIWVWALALLSLWIVSPDTCANWAVTYLGVLPLLFTNTAASAVMLLLTEPLLSRDPTARTTIAAHAVTWTLPEHDAAARRAAARGALPPLHGSGGLPTVARRNVPEAPPFCIELALKLLFWATAVYESHESDSKAFEVLSPRMTALVGSMGAAMALFGLKEREVIYNEERGAMVVVAWSADTVLVTVRGTHEAANVLSDLKVRPPAFRTFCVPVRCTHEAAKVLSDLKVRPCRTFCVTVRCTHEAGRDAAPRLCRSTGNVWQPLLNNVLAFDHV